jgi:WD40 repeat protein
MLASATSGGDIRTFDELLAARKLAAPDESALLHAIAQRSATVKIVETGSAVASVAVNPEGDRLATGSSDQAVRLWDVDSGHPVGGPLTGHADKVTGVAFSPDGHRLASASDDASVRLWDAGTGQPIGNPFTGHTAGVTTVAFSPDGHRLATGSWDETARLWDAESGQPIGEPLVGHTGVVWSVAFGPDGRRLGSASDDTVRFVERRHPPTPRRPVHRTYKPSCGLSPTAPTDSALSRPAWTTRYG